MHEEDLSNNELTLAKTDQSVIDKLKKVIVGKF